MIAENSMSGLYFWWASRSLFRTFLENYFISLPNEKTTTYITLLAYDWAWAANLCSR